ncbi:hypothetical protein V6Z11_A10G159600 [Gossypium hirsutum]
MQKPLNLIQAINLATNFEIKTTVNQTCRLVQNTVAKYTFEIMGNFCHNTHINVKNQFGWELGINKRLSANKRDPPFVKKLTHAKMAERRDKDVCYNCDKPYLFRHQCKKKLFWLEMKDPVDAAQNQEV